MKMRTNPLFTHT